MLGRGVSNGGVVGNPGGAIWKPVGNYHVDGGFAMIYCWVLGFMRCFGGVIRVYNGSFWYNYSD